MRALCLALCLIIGLAACVRDKSQPTSNSAIPLAASASGGPPSPSGKSPASTVVLDFLTPSAACMYGHRGVLLDLGDVSTTAKLTGNKLTAPDVEIREHEGANWLGVHDRSLEVSFVATAESKSENGIVVEARIRGGVAKSAAVYLGGKSLGGMSLTKGETKILTVHAQSASIARGANELLLRFTGGTKSGRDLLAEIDWIRVGPNDGEAPYSAPVASDAISSVSIGGTGRRGISLRAPGFARCEGYLPKGAVLEGFIGVTSGEADAEVQVLIDRAEPRVAGSFHLGGEGAPAWRPISLPLGESGSLGAVELVAKSTAKGARVVFAEARVVAPSTPNAVPPRKSRGVVMVVLGSTPPKLLTPYGGTIESPALADLAQTGVLYESHRATTAYANGAVASMLTGSSARAHGVSDEGASLAPSFVTIAEAARQGGVVTAMFTANPTTGAGFGFGRGWETFAVKDDSIAMFDDVARWLDQHKDDRFLVVVHARGGHPPWDVTSEELKDLPPTGYTGSLDPKRGGELLSKARRTRSFADADRERAFALHKRAVIAHDAALGRLVAHVKSLGRDADTTFIVTGDVGVDNAAHVPFLEDDVLDEPALAVPLVIREPGTGPRANVSAVTSGVDVARTALEALGLDALPSMRGTSLWTTAQRPDEARASLASTSDRFSVRWAGFVTSGVRERETKVCNLSLEADCVSDVRATHPLAAEILHALIYAEPDKPFVAPRSTPSPTEATALKAWGR